MKQDFFEMIKEFIGRDKVLEIEKSIRECDDSVKGIIIKTPDKWLNHHLKCSIKNENYELSAFIRDECKRRGVDIDK